jgi:hypothetical protein
MRDSLTALHAFGGNGEFNGLTSPAKPSGFTTTYNPTRQLVAYSLLIFILMLPWDAAALLESVGWMGFSLRGVCCNRYSAVAHGCCVKRLFMKNLW